MFFVLLIYALPFDISHSIIIYSNDTDDNDKPCNPKMENCAYRLLISIAPNKVKSEVVKYIEIPIMEWEKFATTIITS